MVLLFVLLFFCLFAFASSFSFFSFFFFFFFLEVGGGEGDNMVIISSPLYWSWGVHTLNYRLKPHFSWFLRYSSFLVAKYYILSILNWRYFLYPCSSPGDWMVTHGTIYDVFIVWAENRCRIPPFLEPYDVNIAWNGLSCRSFSSIFTMFPLRVSLSGFVHCFLRVLCFTVLVLGEVDKAFVNVIVQSEDGQNSSFANIVGKFARVGAIKQVEGELIEVKIISQKNPSGALLWRH